MKNCNVDGEKEKKQSNRDLQSEPTECNKKVEECVDVVQSLVFLHVAVLFLVVAVGRMLKEMVTIYLMVKSEASQEHCMQALLWYVSIIYSHTLWTPVEP